MNIRRIIITTALLGAVSGGGAVAATSSSSAASTPATPAHTASTPRQTTPDQCIRRNHGDYNACNVGNSGRGDLPYLPIAR